MRSSVCTDGGCRLQPLSRGNKPNASIGRPHPPVAARTNRSLLRTIQRAAPNAWLTADATGIPPGTIGSICGPGNLLRPVAPAPSISANHSAHLLTDSRRHELGLSRTHSSTEQPRASIPRRQHAAQRPRLKSRTTTAWLIPITAHAAPGSVPAGLAADSNLHPIPQRSNGMPMHSRAVSNHHRTVQQPPDQMFLS